MIGRQRQRLSSVTSPCAGGTRAANGPGPPRIHGVPAGRGELPAQSAATPLASHRDPARPGTPGVRHHETGHRHDRGRHGQRISPRPAAADGPTDGPAIHTPRHGGKGASPRRCAHRSDEGAQRAGDPPHAEGCTSLGDELLGGIAPGLGRPQPGRRIVVRPAPPRRAPPAQFPGALGPPLAAGRDLEPAPVLPIPGRRLRRRVRAASDQDRGRHGLEAVPRSPTPAGAVPAREARRTVAKGWRFRGDRRSGLDLESARTRLHASRPDHGARPAAGRRRPPRGGFDLTSSHARLPAHIEASSTLQASGHGEAGEFQRRECHRHPHRADGLRISTHRTRRQDHDTQRPPIGGHRDAEQPRCGRRAAPRAYAAG